MPIPDDVQAKDVTVDIRPGMACFFFFFKRCWRCPFTQHYTAADAAGALTCRCA